MAARIHRGFGVLHDHDFRQLFAADTISQVGSQVSLLALPLVAVLALGASPLQIGVLAACDTAAFLLVGLPAGAWVDRLRRRRVMIVGDLVRAVVLISVPVAWWLHGLTMPQLYAVGLATGLMTVFFDVAYQSYLPHLVGRDHLVDGNAKLQGVASVAQLGGPTVAGLAIQLLTAPVSVLIDAVSYVMSALFLLRIRRSEAKPEPGPEAHLGREIAEGFLFVVRNRILRAIAICTAWSNLFGSIAGAMFIVLLARDLHLRAGIIGVVFSLASVGGLVGALCARRIAVWLGQGPTIWLAIAVTAPFALLMPLAHRGPLLWAAAVGTTVSSFGAVVYNVTQVSYRQGITPDRLLGRMNATIRFLVWGTLPLGGLIGGVLGTVIGVRPTVWAGAIGGLFAFVPVLLSPLRYARELPAAPAASVAPPVPSAA